MPTKLGRNYLNLCFSKIKNQPSPQSSPATTHTADHRRQPRSFSTAATFISNYNSLYEVTTSDSNSTSKPLFAPANDGADPETYVAVDFITAFTSHRFFFSSPGSSNSIIESTTTTAAESTTTSLSSDDSAGDDDLMIFNNSLAIPTYSPDPYVDFRRSMQEMVEAREEIATATKKSRWEFLHELLLCYLALNPKTTHKHILKAFADLATVTKPPLPPEATETDGSRDREGESVADGGGGCEVSVQQNDRD
ncbi:transcription repressor OFP12-like [Cucurbita pepo subsp. pepo]|uniref:transcription repressor OFP12-like n=1 Tax=Cucurbita pepo subsp. pepo TaxID=3664 RepID=UPI000C9D2E80|nr:transcription repressor OFP12-like [Cucurbita pepo subsp. pepo]